MQYQLDNLDRRILDALQRDGRLQNLELARLVGLSPSACLRRVRLLEEGGYRSLRDVLREDPDRLSIRSGLSNRKARAVQASGREFLENEAPLLEVARAQRMAASAAATQDPEGASANQ